MKTWEEIDVNQVLSFEDFFTLFKKLPLTEEESAEIIDYYKIYATFLEANVLPEIAWISTRNIFIIKNQQIADRIKEAASMNI